MEDPSLETPRETGRRESPEETAPETRGETAPENPRQTLRLTDPLAMRVLAHPLRLRLLGELRLRGPQSVGMLSELVDEAPGSISYHIGRLARLGIVEEAPELARDRREHWWRSRYAETVLEPVDFLADPERQAASGVLRRAVAERYVESVRQYLEAEATMPAEWVGAASSGDAFLHLTSDELAELRDDLDAFVARWKARSDPDREQAQPVSLIYMAFRRP